jgi:trimeric autotransporter adhesin
LTIGENFSRLDAEKADLDREEETSPAAFFGSFRPANAEATQREPKDNLMNPLIQFKTTTPIILIALVSACCALSPRAQAVVPAPDGGYPNGNTAEGTNALFNLTTGSNNTALGALALFSDTAGSNNTATGYLALKNNTASHNTANGYQALFQNDTGVFNTAVGDQALFQNRTGYNNTAIGFNALFSNKTIRGLPGFSNTATGVQALFSNTTGDSNTANGEGALFSNATGGGNTAVGFKALFSNTAFSFNTAVGYQALFSNTSTGHANTATGFQALYYNTTGSENTASGFRALFSNTTGANNTATGISALLFNTTGSKNTADGDDALLNNHGGNENTATGYQALYSNVTANNNTATGYQALYKNTTGFGNTATGVNALLNNTGDGNIALGINAGHDLTTGDNNIDIGNNGVAGESNTIRIGRSGVQQNAYIQGISGATVPSGVTVIVGSDGHLGTIVSSARFKDEIKPMAETSEAILALKPVMFHYKSDGTGTPQFGLIAEEVAEVNSDLVVRDENGEIYTVRYDAVNAMLLNEFLKAHREIEEQSCKIQEQEATIAELKRGMEAVVARLKQQDSKIQDVSDQLELSNASARVASDR